MSVPHSQDNSSARFLSAADNDFSEVDVSFASANFSNYQGHTTQQPDQLNFLPGRNRVPIHFEDSNSYLAPGEFSAASSFVNTQRDLKGLCPICYEEYIDNSPATFMFDCNHAVCIFCARSHFAEFIKRGEVKKIHCFYPLCRVKPSKAQLRTLFLFDEDILQRLQLLEEKRRLESDVLIRFCTRPNCEGIMKMSTTEQLQRILVCPVCSSEVCADCRDSAHPGVTCQENSEKYQMRRADI